MRIILKLSIVLSGLITIGAIWVVQQLSSNFNPNEVNALWSNGNPALFPLIFLMPIIAYFFFSMIFVFEALHRKYNVKRRHFVVGYTLLFCLLTSFTLYRIVDFNHTAQPHFEVEIGYLNPYSNHLFFNAWTFVATLCICAIISFYLKGNKAKRNN